MAPHALPGSPSHPFGENLSYSQNVVTEKSRKITVQDLLDQRARSGRLNAGVAAAADVDSFKTQLGLPQKPMARRWDDRLSDETMRRNASSLKDAAKYLKNPGLISLGGGFPSSEYFPFSQLNLKASTRGHYSESEIDKHGAIITASKHDICHGTSDFDLSVALNYGQGHGSAQMLRWVTEHTELVHNPPYQDWHCTLTVGSTSALDMALRMLAKPGDWMLSEEFTYPQAVESALAMGIRTAEIAMDSEGLRADSMDDLLTRWDETARGGPKPSILYTVPTGQNPTGATQSLQRRRDIYAVARKHDLIIFEDEPYYFMQLPVYNSDKAQNHLDVTASADFLAGLVPSYVSLDIDGRVLRMDSFSKTLAPGARLGWITGPKQLTERYRMHADLATQGPGGFSQLALFKLLDELWGHEGYFEWLLHISNEYTARRDTMLKACEQHLPTEFVKWVAPTAGMFQWLEVEYQKHPQWPEKSVLELEERIFLRTIETGALLMRGSWFRGERDTEVTKLFFRATYAAAPADSIEEAIKRFGDAVRMVFAERF